MGWLFSSSNKRSNDLSQSSYPEKTSKKVLCNRKHCSEKCESQDGDIYKFWCLYLATTEISNEELLENLHTLPVKLRNAFYMKQAGNIHDFDVNEYYNYLKNYKESKNDAEAKSNIILDTIVKDKIIVDEIFKQCQIYNFKDEEVVFNIYKKLGKDFEVSNLALIAIFEFLSMDYATPEGVYTFIRYLYLNHGFADVIKYKRDKLYSLNHGSSSSDSTLLGNEKVVDNLKSAIKETGDGIQFVEGENEQKKETTKTLKEIAEEDLDEKDKGSTEENGKSGPDPNDKNEGNNLQGNNDVDIKEVVNMADEVQHEYKGLFMDRSSSNDTVNEVPVKKDVIEQTHKNDNEYLFNHADFCKTLITYEFDIFFTLTDVVIATNKTYYQVLDEAREVSNINDVKELLRMIKAKSNMRYYHVADRKVITEPKPTKQTYFDFLVIQDELIKAQQNIKEQFRERESPADSRE